MSQSKISKYSIAEISDMVKQTESLSDVLLLMGYKQVNSKNVLSQLQKICDENNIPYSYVHSPFKVCSLCNKRKSTDEYYKMNERYMSFCKECQKEKERVKYAQKQEEFIDYKKLYIVRNVEKADFIYSIFIIGIQKKKIMQYQTIVVHLQLL